MEKFDVAIVGGGISGLTATSELCRLTSCRVLILEQGQSYLERLSSDSPNLLEGLGGAGTVGGGKLCFPPASGEIWRKTASQYSRSFYQQMKRQFSQFSAIPNRLHDETAISCDFANRCYEKIYDTQLLLQQDMSRFIQELIQSVSRRATLCTNSRLTGYCDDANGKVVFYTDMDGQTHRILTRFLVLACGRSFARELPQLLPATHLIQQPVDLGIRLLFPRRKSGIFYQAGQDVKLKANYGDVSVRTFCVCSGGTLATLHYYGQTYYDGHFGKEISHEVNIGILARLTDCMGTEAAIEYLMAYQDMVNRDISLGWFLKNWKSISKKPEHEKLFSAIARFADFLLASGRLGAGAEETRVVMPSADRLNPLVRTNEEFCTPDSRVWVIGDAAGISRGFVQSCWSGFCAAAGLVEKLSLEENRGMLWG